MRRKESLTQAAARMNLEDARLREAIQSQKDGRCLTPPRGRPWRGHIRRHKGGWGARGWGRGRRAVSVHLGR